MSKPFFKILSYSGQRNFYVFLNGLHAGVKRLETIGVTNILLHGSANLRQYEHMRLYCSQLMLQSVGLTPPLQHP